MANEAELVERLRNPAKYTLRGGEPPILSPNHTEADMCEAADTIERLTAERDALKRDEDGWKAEIERLVKVQFDLTAERDAAQAKLAEAVEVLKFYRDCWDTHPGDSGPGGNYPQDPVCDPNCDLLEDGGNLARKFLTSLEDKPADG